MQRPRTWITALMLGLLLLAGCGASPAEEGPGGQVSEDSAGAGAEGESSGGDAGAEAEGHDADRAVITAARATLEVGATDEAVADVVELVGEYEGVVESRRETADAHGEPIHASLTLRVPAESLDDLLEGLDEVGDVVARSETSRDVTGESRDLDARIEALETSVDRLLEIMEESETSEDLLQAETTLSERQSELESLQAERSGLEDQVEMSTVELELSGEPLGGAPAGGFLGGLQAGWRGLLGAADSLVVAVGMALPAVAVLAIPATGAVLLVRRRLRRRRQSRREAAPTPTSGSAPQ